MSGAVFEKPLSDLTWADLEDIVTKGLEEDQTLEFKETLPAKDGNSDPWQSGKDKIGEADSPLSMMRSTGFAGASEARVLDRVDPLPSLRKPPMLVARPSPSMGPAACLLATSPPLDEWQGALSLRRPGADAEPLPETSRVEVVKHLDR